MTNRYTNLDGNEKINESYNHINDGFDHVERDIDGHASAAVLAHPDGSVTTSKLADKGTTRAKIGDKAVGTGQIGDKAVTTGQLGDKAVGMAQIADGAVTPTQLSFDPATQSELDAVAAAKVDKIAGKQLSTEDYTSSEKTKLSGVATGAEVNQNTFAVVAVTGQSDVVADAKSDTLTLAGGTGITITTDATTDKVTITATGTATPGAHASSHLPGGSDPISLATNITPGLMSADDRKRLDTEATTSIVLSAGQQILNATKNARLQGLKVQGRTLIDLLGGVGGCESLVGWTNAGTTAVTVSTTQKRSGASSLKVAPAGTTSYVLRDFDTPLDTTKYYLVGMWLYIESYASGTLSFAVLDKGTYTYRHNTTLTPVLGWQFVTLKVPINNLVTTSGYRLLIGSGGVGTYVAYMDEIRLYAVSAADYAAIGTTITGEAIDRLLPYVPPGINGVDGLWVRRFGKNLLPSMPGYIDQNAKSLGPYTLQLNATTGYQTSEIKLEVFPNRTYTISCDTLISSGVAVINMAEFTSDAAHIKDNTIVDSNSGIKKITVLTSATTHIIKIYLYSTIASNIVFSNWQLEIGNTATPFQPREDSLIAFSGVELHANPNDGTEPDVLREVNGRYEVTRLWRKMVLDGSLGWGLETWSVAPGRKGVSALIRKPLDNHGFITKFNGELLPYAGNLEVADTHAINPAVDKVFISIANASSGWGDSYTPSQAEIQAYFYGYQMGSVSGGVFTTPYVSGTKTWRYVTGDNSAGTTTLPTTLNPGNAGWQPYQLLYRLATPITETVQEDGSLSLLEGDNFIEVGSGYVSRELARPKKHPSMNRLYIGLNDAGNGGDSSLKKRTYEIKQVFKNSLPDFWNFDKLSDGTFYAWTDNYDTAASYSVSYIKLDKSPVPSVTGAYAATEKAQLHDLTDAVTEIGAAVSVLAAKKSEKDAPAWITPTVLNGWSNRGQITDAPASFMRDPMGYVHLRGIVTGGTLGAVMKLPVSYRPPYAVQVPASSVASGGALLNGYITIQKDGDVFLNAGLASGSGSAIFLDAIVFLAEQ